MFRCAPGAALYYQVYFALVLPNEIFCEVDLLFISTRQQTAVYGLQSDRQNTR